MSTLIRFTKTSTARPTDSSTTYRDLTVPGDTSGFQPLDTDSAAGPDERPFRVGGTGPAITFYSERATSDFALAGPVTIQLSGFASDAAFTGRFRLRLWKITHGGSDIETYVGMTDATADLSTTTTLFTLAALTPAVPVTIYANERLVARVSAIPTGAGGTSFGTGTATWRYNLSSSGMSLTETVTFLRNGTTLLLRRTATTGIGSFLDLIEARGVLPFTLAKVLSVGSATELQWTNRTQSGTPSVTELTAAAIANTANVATYTSASFTPVANRLYLLAVTYSDAAPETTEATITTTTGLNFVAVPDIDTAAVSQPFNTIASNGNRLMLFRAMKASGLSAGTYTVNFADAATGCAALLAEVTGVATSGTDGSGAVRNGQMAAGDNTANPTVSVVDNLESYNGIFACVGSSLATVPTPKSGYTALSNPDYATPTTGLCAQWKAAFDSGPTFTLTASNWAVIACELVAAQTSAVIEWLSPRVKQSFTFGSIEHCIGNLAGWTHSTDGLVNAGMRAKVFHRAPDGTETLVYTNSGTTELAFLATTLLTPWTQTSGTLNQSKLFEEDDRLIVRVYLINVGGTMGDGYPCSLSYDYDLATANGDSYLRVFPASTFKAESDPARVFRIEGSLTMGGVGN